MDDRISKCVIPPEFIYISNYLKIVMKYKVFSVDESKEKSNE